MLPVKHSIAVIVFRGDQVLTIRRSENDDELPGIWGLPAGTFKPEETLDGLVMRIGREKLGVRLTPVRHLASGSQNRSNYRLNMDLWEASMHGTPAHPEWRWASVDSLREGMAAGSLCCGLAVKNKSRAS